MLGCVCASLRESVSASNGDLRKRLCQVVSNNAETPKKAHTSPKQARKSSWDWRTTNFECSTKVGSCRNFNWSLPKDKQ